MDNLQVEHHICITLYRRLRFILEQQLGQQTDALLLLAEPCVSLGSELMVGCRALGEVLTVVTRTTAAYGNRGHQW